jgi:DNA-binding GntR family transcriptional regulator
MPPTRVNAQASVTTAGPARGATVEYVRERLREGIMRGQYAPGQRLIEADLTRLFGISRGPLREAYRRLAAEGLLEMIPHRGAFVRRLSLREMSELFEIRIALEALGARLASAAMSQPEVRAKFKTEIAAIFVDERRAGGPGYLDENSSFHAAIVRASGNLQLLALTGQLQLPLILNQLATRLRPETILTSVTEHRAVARAILAGDADTAERLVKAHLERALALARSMPRDDFGWESSA